MLLLLVLLLFLLLFIFAIGNASIVISIAATNFDILVIKFKTHTVRTVRIK
jgi:hypothetical protein